MTSLQHILKGPMKISTVLLRNRNPLDMSFQIEKVEIQYSQIIHTSNNPEIKTVS